MRTLAFLILLNLTAGCATSNRPHSFSGEYAQTDLGHFKWDISLASTNFNSEVEAKQLGGAQAKLICENEGFPTALTSVDTKTDNIRNFQLVDKPEAINGEGRRIVRISAQTSTVCAGERHITTLSHVKWCHFPEGKNVRIAPCE